MKNKRLFLFLLALFAALMAGAYVLYDRLSGEISTDQLAAQQPSQEQSGQSSSQDQSQPQTIPAPDVTVYREDGSAVQLSDFFGKPIVLNFWASWCGPCKQEMPDFHEAFLAQGDEIHFLMINATTGRETVETAADFIAQQEYTFPVFYDTTTEAAMTYGAYSLPTTFFIDAQGNAVAQAVGSISADILQQGLDMIVP